MNSEKLIYLVAAAKRVGNITIDSLEMLREKIERQTTYKQFSLIPGEYGVVTLHRPSTVDICITYRTGQR